MHSFFRFVAGSFIACVIAGVAAVAVSAQPVLDWGRIVNAGSCQTTGAPVINVTNKVVNTVDSGLGGYWAFDDFNRTIQVWPQPNGTYCAVVHFAGQFDAQAGATSPGATGVLTGAEDGAFEGGYVAIISGTLLADPSWKTHGNTGTFDYACDLSANCPGSVNWVAQYFGAGYTFDYAWWGWIYHAGQFGTWVNSIDGNVGDIH